MGKIIVHKESSRKVLVQHFLVQILVQTFCYPCAVLVRGPLCRFLVRDLCLVQVLVQILVRAEIRESRYLISDMSYLIPYI